MTARKRQVGPVDPGPKSSAVVKREGRSRGKNVTGPRLMLLSRLGELLVFSDALAFRLLEIAPPGSAIQVQAVSRV